MTKLKDKPFALIGVNSWTDDPAKLKEVMTLEKLNWRSFTGDERINRQWNFPATPTMYVLDPTGTIRHKWVGKVGDKVVDATLDRLIANAASSIEPVGQWGEPGEGEGQTCPANTKNVRLPREQHVMDLSFVRVTGY